MEQIKSSDFLAEFFRVQKIDYVFEVAGGMITHFLDSLYRLGNTNIISVHHEQAAAFAADAVGRYTGRPGVAFATSGPGATNLLTGIGSCYFDSSPALFITGQVNTHELKGNRKVRQNGFQETDIVSMAMPITKKCFRLEKAEELPEVLHEAFSLTISDRPGPVLIDIPMNLQSIKINKEKITYIERTKNSAKPNLNTITLLFDALKKSQRPLILAGRGINVAQINDKFLKFIQLLNIPVVTSLLALDVLPYDHPLRVGFIGSYGNRWANVALGTADVLLVLGSRLDIRQTGADVVGFATGKTIFHVDCDENEINNRVQNCIAIHADVEDFIDLILAHCSDYNKSTGLNNWLNEIDSLKQAWPDVDELKDIIGINPNKFMHAICKYSHSAVGFIADVGNHQMWAAQSLELSKQFFYTSAGMGSMGFALPAAIGASFCCKRKPVVVIAGDGGFQMNIQELQTIVRNKLPIKMIILNNGALGMIRQFQDSYFQGRYQSTYWGYSAPDFQTIAQAYGIATKTIVNPNEVEFGAKWIWEQDGPVLLQVMINPYVNVYPKIAFGKPITEMEPFATPIQMECT